MFLSTGTLQYSKNKLIVEVDFGLANYYCKQLSYTTTFNLPRYAPHISVVREEPYEIDHWQKHQGEIVEFAYEHDIRTDNVYYWLAVECKRLREIRRELCLPELSWVTKSPDLKDSFHITIANKKSFK